MKLRRCYVCGKRIWLFPIKVINRLSGRHEEYWVHQGCLDNLHLPDK